MAGHAGLQEGCHKAWMVIHQDTRYNYQDGRALPYRTVLIRFRLKAEDPNANLQYPTPLASGRSSRSCERGSQRLDTDATTKMSYFGRRSTPLDSSHSAYYGRRQSLQHVAAHARLQSNHPIPRRILRATRSLHVYNGGILTQAQPPKHCNTRNTCLIDRAYRTHICVGE